jgi:hypothetical protein
MLFGSTANQKGMMKFPRGSKKRKLAAQILARPGKGVLYDFSLDD